VTHFTQSKHESRQTSTNLLPFECRRFANQTPNLGSSTDVFQVMLRLWYINSNETVSDHMSHLWLKNVTELLIAKRCKRSEIYPQLRSPFQSTH
jgi:hypothetical protein